MRSRLRHCRPICHYVVTLFLFLGGNMHFPNSSPNPSSATRRLHHETPSESQGSGVGPQPRIHSPRGVVISIVSESAVITPLDSVSCTSVIRVVRLDRIAGLDQFGGREKKIISSRSQARRSIANSIDSQYFVVLDICRNDIQFCCCQPRTLGIRRHKQTFYLIFSIGARNTIA